MKKLIICCLFFISVITVHGQGNDNVSIPGVAITNFSLRGSPLPVDSLQALNEVIIPTDKNYFSIGFTSPNAKSGDKYTYYYQMKGLSDEWIRTTDQFVAFDGLSTGHYVFAVKAVDAKGVASKNISHLSIFVKPPFWRTGWFISTIVTVLSLLFYSMHRQRINRILAIEKIRNRVARDLHDDMGSTLSTINILSTMAKARLHTDVAKAGEYLDKISDNSQRMMDAMDDIVWAIKPSNDSMQKVISRMREFATSVFEAKNIDLTFQAEEDVHDIKIDMEGRRDLFLIFKEAANNAAKYSGGDSASVRLFVQGKKLMLVVKDNGTGFDVKSADNGNGLGNMHKRAQLLRGRLDIQSTIGEGTTVTLCVSINQNT